jgi:GR25 family glycosyltransferase involved in LPS biosynthesis
MVDAILYINLEHRLDRKELILHEIQKIKNIDEGRIYRIDAVLEPMCGHIGCGKSHIKALELAIENNWSSVLILEDDFVFNEHYEGEHSFNKIQPIEWDVVLLAQVYHCNQDSEYNFLKRARRSTTTSGYIVRRHYYPVLLDNFKSSVAIMEREFQFHSENCIAQNEPVSKLNICSAIDQHWFSLQDRDTFYAFNSSIGHQRNSWSDNNCSCEYQEHQIKLHHVGDHSE